jgi:hypothetical protein
LVEVVDTVIAMVRASGIPVDEPVMLRSTNNLVAWLSLSAVVAKIAPDAARDLGVELSWAHALVKVGAPVVPPAPLLGEEVYRIADRDVTFWEHAPQDTEPPLTSAALAGALGRLHAALGELAPPRRMVVEDLETTIHALDDDCFAPGLGRTDRELLQHHMRATVEMLGRLAVPVHGSPHESNVLSLNGAARFIDLETIALGQVEWDLAHLEPEVAVAYPTHVDTELLARCRLAVSARTAALCWHDRDRGPDMIWHARHHLDIVRRADM